MSTPVTRSTNEQIVQKAYDAFARGDIDAAVADLHPDVEWIEPDTFPMGGTYAGPAAFHRYLSLSREGWRELSTDVVLHPVNDKVIAVHHLTGVLTDGASNEATVADVFTLQEGTVVHMRAYADPDEAFIAEGVTATDR